MQKKKSRAYQLIKDAIFKCELLPGQVLNETALAESLGVSRTPLREALAALEREGFINIIPNRGAFVSEITVDEVNEILDVRGVLEGYAVRLATHYIPDDELDALLVKTNEYLEKKICDPGQMLEIDMAVHNLFLDYCGNKTLKNLLRHIGDNIKRMRIRSTLIRERLDKSTIEHRSILEAAKLRDPEKAEELMKMHIQNARKNAIEALRIPIIKRN